MPFPPSMKDSYLKRKYGIGIDEYSEMLAKNNFSCFSCNAALGMFDDNINVMKNCIKYLKENEK